MTHAKTLAALALAALVSFAAPARAHAAAPFGDESSAEETSSNPARSARGTAGSAQFGAPQFPPPGAAGEWTKDYKRALERAASERKPLVLYFSPIWCHYCRVLESQILPTPEFAATAKDAIFVWLDPDLMGDGYSLSKSMKVKKYPTVVVMHAGPERLRELKRVTGVYPRKEYVERFQKALKSWTNADKKTR